MATLTELVNTVAKITGMETATVALVARHAREAGLIAMSGRGPSAASMGLTDATNLLIAVNTAKHASEVALAVPLYRKLVPYKRDADGNRHIVESAGTFGQVIEQLIRAAATGIFPDPFMGRQMPAEAKDYFAKGRLQFLMKFNLTFVAAALRFVSAKGGDELPDYPPRDAARAVLAFDFFPPAHKRIGRVPYQFFPGPGRAAGRSAAVLGNRIEEATIGHQTFRAVGQLIAPYPSEPTRQ